MKRYGQRRGIFLADAVLGLAIVTVLAAALAYAAHRHSYAARKLAQTRAAVRLAEDAMLRLRGGQAATQPSVRVKRLAADGAPKGMAWVEVSAQSESQRASLVGLVPESAAAGGQP